MMTQNLLHKTQTATGCIPHLCNDITVNTFLTRFKYSDIVIKMNLTYCIMDLEAQIRRLSDGS